MTATFQTLGVIAQQPDFQQRVYVALIQAALNVYSESTAVVGHVTRAAFAENVLKGGLANGPTWFYGVVTSTAIMGEASTAVGAVGYGILDTDIANQVSAMWNAMAGV